MTFRLARPGDEAEVEAILAARPEATMFPRTNLRDHGLTGQGGAHASRFWTDGASVVALSGDGMLMPCLAAPSLAVAAGAALAGERVTGVVGPAPDARALLAALGLSGVPCRTDRDEPGFVLDLPELRMPDGPGDLNPVTAADAFVIDWRADYHAEVLGTPRSEARDRAARDIAGYVARGSHRILRVGGVPVAFSGFNAILPGIVQIGGVYVPPDFRGRGHGGQVVARHLAQAGVPRACLFAASDAAARAYVTIGFRPAAPVSLVLFAAAQILCGIPA